jgi:(p)ppGpp synthase/HD superfamily hydrolase
VTSDDIRRDRAMEDRIARTLEDAAVPPADIALVVSAHRLGMTPRLEGRMDPHHPDFLHPGRTVLILLLDTALRDPAALAAAALLDSERDEMRVAPAVVRAEVGASVATFAASVPMDESSLVEDLVTAPEAVRLVALAERLDHCRHAKFWPDPLRQARIHQQAQTVFGPLAERTDAVLARRFSHWIGAFGRTLARRS